MPFSTRSSFEVSEGFSTPKLPPGFGLRTAELLLDVQNVAGLFHEGVSLVQLVVPVLPR